MLDKLWLPYTCFSRLTRAVQTHAFESYELCRKVNAPLTAEQITLLREINPELLDKVALFLSRKEIRLSASLVDSSWLYRLRRKPDFKTTDAIQQLRTSIVGNAYQPWSNHYVYDWSMFLEWYNQLSFTHQCGVNDALEVLVGKSLLKFTEEFSLDILAHAKAGQNFYPAPQYNEYTQCYERPEVLMHKFSVDIRKIQSARELSRSFGPFDDEYSHWGGVFDDDEPSNREDKNSKDTPPRYPEIKLPQSINRGCFSSTLRGSLRDIFALQGYDKKDHTCKLSYENTIIAKFKHIKGNVSLHNLSIPHDIPGFLTKDILMSEIQLISLEFGATNVFRALLDNELAL